MEKIRLVLMVEDEIRDALRLEGALSGKDMQDIVSDLVKIHLADALSQIRQRRAKADKAKKNKDSP